MTSRIEQLRAEQKARRFPDGIVDALRGSDYGLDEPPDYIKLERAEAALTEALDGWASAERSLAIILADEKSFEEQERLLERARVLISDCVAGVCVSTFEARKEHDAKCEQFLADLATR